MVCGWEEAEEREAVEEWEVKSRVKTTARFK
jgi:hypothetical protein